MYGDEENDGETYESPESPPPFDQNALFSQTKIRIETDDGLAGLRFSLDRMGHQNYGGGGGYSGGEGGMSSMVQRPSSSSSIPTRREPMFDESSSSGGRGHTSRETGFWSSDDRGRPGGRPATATATSSSSSDWGYNNNSRESYSPRSPDRQEERNYSRREPTMMPLYDVESEVMLSGISARGGQTSDIDRERNDRITPPAPRPKNCCWNCKGDHMITECPVPRDPRRIAANRKIFMASKLQRNDYSGGSAGGGRAKRYHEEQSGRLGSAKPGELSEALRYAMELDTDEVPIHVYRMRLFGYPPGWLENAMEEASSGLKLYGDAITMPVGCLKRDPKINPDSIIPYPGFNAPMPFGQIDRGKEYDCPRYRTEDSIENMLQNLNSKNLVSEGDGIVSQSIPPSQPPQWDSLAGLDRPVLNDGASHGIGRGRYIEVDTLPRHLQPGRGILGSGPPRPRSPVYRERMDRETRPRPRQQQRTILIEDVDERYLPQQPKTIAQKRGRRNSRSASPSLLREDGGGDIIDLHSPVIPARPTKTGRSTSPVIVNLPPVPGSPKNKNKNCESDADDETGGTTGSSNDFSTSPKPKRRKEDANESDDDEVTIIPTNKDSTFEYDSDCLVIDTQEEASSPDKSVRPKQSSPVKKVSKSVPNSEVVQVDSLDSEDWENDKRVVTRPKPLPSPGSSTGDEASFMPKAGDGGKGLTKPPKPSVRDNFDEDWEVGSNNSDKLVIVEEEPVVEPQGDDENGPNSSINIIPAAASDNSSQQKHVPRPAEFIPSNPQNEAIKEVLLAHFEDADENEKSFTSLPAFEKFAHGMPEMVFETDAPERIGRLDKVLQVLKTRKSAGNIPLNDNHKK